MSEVHSPQFTQPISRNATENTQPEATTPTPTPTPESKVKDSNPPTSVRRDGKPSWYAYRQQFKHHIRSHGDEVHHDAPISLRDVLRYSIQESSTSQCLMTLGLVIATCVVVCVVILMTIQYLQYPQQLYSSLTTAEAAVVPVQAPPQPIPPQLPISKPQIDWTKHLGVATAQGGRTYMEDRYKVQTDLLAYHAERLKADGTASDRLLNRITQFESDHLASGVFAVFDGHGGERAAEFCRKNFVNHLVASPRLLTQPMQTLRETYKALDDKFIKEAVQHAWTDGTTAVAAVIFDGRMYVANAGDSRAILCSQTDQGTPLSNDHKPTRKDERERIEGLGGQVSYNEGWRVQGVLGVSRAIGDASLKPYVTSEPEVGMHELGANDAYLIIGSDGVWDVLSNTQACKLAGLSPNPTVAAHAIIKAATSKGSQDNITALVVNLRPFAPPA